MKFVQIPVERILPSPHNPRHEALGLDELAQSIKAVGIIEPLVVAIVQDDPEHVTLVCGNRRYGAAKLAGLKQVPCLVLPAVGERTERTISLVENLHRRDMSHIEQGEAFRALMDTGLTQNEVAKQTGVSIFTVNTKVNLVNKLVPAMQELVHRDRMTLTEAISMAKLPADTQQKIIESGRGSLPRLSTIPSHRRTKTEAAIMAALQHYRDGSLDLCLAELKRASGYLEHQVEGAA